MAQAHERPLLHTLRTAEGLGMGQVESKRVAHPMPDGGMIDRAKTLTLPGKEIDRGLQAPPPTSLASSLDIPHTRDKRLHQRDP